MKHTYKITGMTCNGCRSHVEETLQKVDGVKSVSVDLEKAEAEIEMEGHIPWDIFETALQQGGGNYHILKPGTTEKESAEEGVKNGISEANSEEGAGSNFSKVPKDDHSVHDGTTASDDQNFGKVASGMIHTYKITGMTCNGCRSHVEKTLQSVDGVKTTSVDLEKGEAVIEMERHIPWDIFDTALQKGGGNYHILAPGTSEEKSTEKGFKNAI